MTPVVVWDVIRGIILPSAVLPQPMGPRNLPFAFAYALCPAGTLYRNFLLITNVCVPTRNVIEPNFYTFILRPQSSSAHDPGAEESQQAKDQ